MFYEIYAEADKRRDLGKHHTGIFMFKDGDNAPFAMSGGWRFCLRRLAARGRPHRQARGGTGLYAFVVKYRVGKDNGEIMMAK